MDGVVEIPLPSRYKAKPTKHRQIADFNETEAERLGLDGSDTTDRDTHLAGTEETAGQEKRR